MISDIKRVFRTAFGTTVPNKNINKNVINNNIREYPKNLGGILKAIGIPFGRKLAIGEFSRFIKGLEDGHDCTSYSIYGEYLNMETESVSVGHLSSNDIYYIIGDNGNANNNNGSIGNNKIATTILDSWYKINVRTLKYNVIRHMFNTLCLNKYKEITHVELSLKDSTYSVVMNATLFINTYRKVNGKMELDMSI